MIRDRLDDARRRLLDLSRRNRLLNFKPTAAGVVRIVREDPEAIHDILCVQQKGMRFLPNDEPPTAALASDEASASREGGAEFDLPADIADATPTGEPDKPDEAARTDLNLQTPHTGPRLQTLLLNLSRQAESAIQEQGCNILYLTIGLLEWADRTGARSLAPLLLIPVELQRRSVRHRYVLRAIDDEPVVNPVLREMCRVAFNVELPEFDPSRERPVAALFEAMGRIMVPGQAWTLQTDMHVATLSFAKLLMYSDLDPARWPATSRLEEHPLVVSLCGLASPWPRRELGISGPTELDDRIPPSETFQVLDADSSQEIAILAAKRGVSLVIEGPPGTGKSQTITNIIAECLAAGKTVLFVAEKAAALEVVKRRLEQVGLGAFVAELHSRKASKRAFVEDLSRALAGHGVKGGGDAGDLSPEELARLRASLNHYVRALHCPVRPLNLTPHDAIARCVHLQSAPEAPFAMPEMLQWTRDQLDRATDAVRVLANAATRAGEPKSHAWRGVGLRELPLTVRQGVSPALAATRTALQGVVATANRLATTMGLGNPQTIDHALAVAKAADAIVSFPKDDARSLRNAAWNTTPPDVQALLTRGRRLEQIRELIEDRWLTAAEAYNWTDVEQAWKRLAHRRWRVFSPTWWSIRRAVRQHLQPGVRPRPQRIADDLALLVEARGLAHEIRGQQVRGEALFGSLWKGDHSPWGELERRAGVLVVIRQPVAMGIIDDDALEQACVRAPARPHAQPSIDAIRWAVEKLRHEFKALAAPLRLELAFLGQPLERTMWTDLDARLSECAKAGESALDDWVELQRATDAAAALGLRPFLDWTNAGGREHGPATWVDAFLRQFHRVWLDHHVRESESLRLFRAANHEHTIDAFRRLDAAWLTATRARLAHKIAVERPRLGQATTAGTGLGILEAEVRRRRNIKPIRGLLASPCAEAILRLKPCFMMSPLSVAQYLEPGRLNFDVVVFDEASQIEPADAIGALARGKQIVLVGDEKQLPPTNFFASLLGEDREPDAAELAMPAVELESVLGVGQAHLAARTTLRWHYRSRHETLIEFSNGQFYDGALHVFPSPHRHSNDYGVRLIHVEDGVYRRARGQDNPIEAQRVAEAVIEHARAHPDISLGVGAFSVAQQRAIEDAIERLRVSQQDARVEAFFDPAREEPFFVKNLETVQGDERDAMILSVGYGPDETGRIINNFGPLNLDGGWRRLNVLITRARRTCSVYTSLRPEQIRVDANTPRGVRALRGYLDYAARQTSSAGTDIGEAPPPPGHAMRAASLAAHIAAALRDRGFRTAANVGCEGFTIDIAILSEDGRRCEIGIETDGPVYASCPTARDRDRLRDLVLGNLGWRIVRTWAIEWLADPARALDRLLRGIDEAMRSDEPPRDAAPPPTPAAEAPHRAEAPPSPSEDSLPPGVVPYERFRVEPIGDRNALLRAGVEELGELIQRVAAVEGPIHVDEVRRLVCDAYQSRAVGQAPAHVETAITAVALSGAVRRDGPFLMPADMTHPRVRWRDAFDAVTSPDLIWPGEVAESAVYIVRHEFGAAMDDLGAAALRRMGFKRITPPLEALGRAGVDLAVRQGRIVVDANNYARPVSS